MLNLLTQLKINRSSYKICYKSVKRFCSRQAFSPLGCSKTCVINFNNGQTLKIETGGFARMADGAAVVTVGDTSVLSTAVSVKSSKGASSSFLPLTVDYKIKYAGSLQSNLTRFRQASMEKEILTSRAIDRSIRPLFPSRYLFETQVLCQLMAIDGYNDPDVACINAASAALSVSDIPWNGPLGAVRAGFIDGEVIIFPTRHQLAQSSIDLIIACTRNNLVVMLEGAGKNLPEDDLMNVIRVGTLECQKIIEGIQELANHSQKIKRKLENVDFVDESELEESIRLLCENKLKVIFTDFSHHKISRDEAVQNLREEAQVQILESLPDTDTTIISKLFSNLSKNVFRNLILDENIRCDGRSLTDLRNISCGINIFKPLHGSSIFQRGQTQVQSTVTLDAPMNQRRVDTLLEATGGVRHSNFILSYNFPKFATNEVGKTGMPSRREIGHGALAEKALKPLIPHNVDHSISLSATVMESNGSSSMATVCGGSLALMDAGVNLSSAAAGVAVGLITRYNEEGNLLKYTLLTDLLGIEDYLGDMDFKIGGTRKGLTALQLDVKVPGIPLQVVSEAISQGRQGIHDILDIMAQTIKAPRDKTEKSDVMPVIKTLECPIQQRPRLYGVNGVRKIELETGVQITWLEETKLSIFAPNQSMMDEAMEYLTNLLSSAPDLVFGAIYDAVITEVQEKGIFVILYDGMRPVLVHNSQLDTRTVRDARVLNFEVGQKVKLKYFGSDPATGRIRLSRRVLQVTKDAVRDLTSRQ